MKIAPTKHSSSTKKDPLLPLVPDPLDEMRTENSVSYNVRADPTDRDSSTYKKYVRILSGSESIRTILKWAEDTTQVIEGLNVTDVAVAYTMLYNMMGGSAQASFAIKVQNLAKPLHQQAVDAEGDATAKAALVAAG